MNSFFPVFDMNNLSHISVVWKKACHKYRRALSHCQVPSFKKWTKLWNDEVNFTITCANTTLQFLELGRASWQKKEKETVTQECAALGWGRANKRNCSSWVWKTKKIHQVDYNIFYSLTSLTWDTDLIFPLKLWDHSNKIALVLYAWCAGSSIPTHGNNLGSNENLFLSNSRIINNAKT